MGSIVIHGASRREIIDEITHSSERFYTIQHCCKGNVLYAVHESEQKDGTRFRFIGVHLLFKSSDGWGYKSMSEDMGPYNYTCPLKYLEMAPDGDAGSKNARDWRAEVRKQTAEREKVSKPRVGDTLVFKPGTTLAGEPLERAEVTVRRGRGIYVRAIGFGRVKVSARHIERIERASNVRRDAIEHTKAKYL